MRRCRIWAAAVFMAGIAVFMAGCTKRELEDRYFPLAVELHKLDGGYGIEYALPDMGGETGQEKGQDQQSEEEEKDTKEESAVADTPGEAAMEYAANVDKFIDTGHTKAVILGPEVLEDPDARKEVLSYFEDQESYARNTLVFVYEASQKGSMTAQTASSVKSLGTYLEDLMENNPGREARQRVTIGDLMNFWHNQEEEIRIPELAVRNKKPALDGDFLVQNVDKSD